MYKRVVSLLFRPGSLLDAAAKHLQLLLFGAIAVLGASGAMAQGSPSDTGSAETQAQASHQELQEVVVSARRRTESLQNVPVAVEVISKGQLQNNDATDLSKIAELAPQVLIGPAIIATGGLISIRGISTDATDPGLDQSVTTVIDGVPLSRGRVMTQSTFDMQQVEVMEGPQALFFGKNSPAGVIVLQTADPTDHLEGYVRAGYEFVAHERYEEGAISGPITDTFSARLAFRVDAMDGWIQNNAEPVADPLHPGVVLPGAIYGNTGPAGDDYAVRLTLRWAPSDDFDAKLKVTWDEQTMNAMDAYAELYCTGGQTVPTEEGFPLPGASCQKNMVKSESAEAPQYAMNFPYGNNGVPYSFSQFELASLTLDKRFDQVTLTSVTGYYNQTYNGAFSADYSPFTELYDSQHEVYQLVTQEVRANTDFRGPLNFMGGLYFEHSERPFVNTPDLFHAALDPSFNNYADVEGYGDSKATTYSGFVQARWNIIPTVELAGGARYTSVKENAIFDNIEANPVAATLGIDLYPQGQILPAHYSDHNVSPEATLSWHPEPDQTLYTAYKTGYKPGGISNGSLVLDTATPANLLFGSEKTHGFEVGYKADLLAHTLRLDLTVYRYDYNGLQVATYYAPTFSFNIGNAAAARTQGVEASTEWLATEQLSFKGNLGYNRARYVSYPNAQCYDGQTAASGCVNGEQNLAGFPLNRAPNLTYNLGADYKAKLVPGWTTDMSLDGAYTSSYQTDSDYAPGGVQDSFWRLNAAVHMVSDNGHFDLAVIGRNLTNSYYMIYSTTDPVGANTQYIGLFNRPREVILQAEYRL
jgi:iron complex outermembrane receptor protein